MNISIAVSLTFFLFLLPVYIPQNLFKPSCQSLTDKMAKSDSTETQQLGFVKDNGIISTLHINNIGRITFMGKLIPIEEYTETDFLDNFQLKDSIDFNIRIFMKTSLTNYLYELAPELSVEELTNKGNFQFSFYADDSLIYTENLNPGAGSKESKNTLTVFRVPLISTTDEDSWGRFLWQRFMLNGGEEALSEGTHKLKIIIRPYIKTTEIKAGGIIAEGEIAITKVKPKIDEKQMDIQYIMPGSGWKISNDEYDKELIRKLNLKIQENTFKEITSIVVVKEGKLLLEEYFNNTSRNTLHDTRSIGKSFASAITGIAINEGYIKNVNVPLKKFYNLKEYDNYSILKENISIKNLLTMTSGLKGNDMDDTSPGNEENMYPTDNWVKFALDLPMDSAKITGKDWEYFTAGVVVLGDILHKSTPEGLEKYAEKKLFNPLGIKQYQWQYTPQHVANTAGGLRMRSVDYAKFGQLYKTGGIWNEKQVIPKSWVESTLSKYIAIPGSENEFYGYLFWYTNFTVNGNNYEAFYSSGNGGNKIFIFKDLPLVVVITSTAYNKPYAHSQINKIMVRYILPALIR